MAEFVKKTLVGYKEVPGGHTNPECTHVILSLKEYKKQLRQIATAEQETRNIKDEAEKTLRNVQNDAKYKIQTAKAEAAKTVADMAGELEAERRESAYQRNLNANLLRITRERANADRGLRPKKEHTGYFVVSSTEKEYHYKDRYHSGIQVKMLWETTIQSPYSVDFTEEEARKQIQELTKEMEDGNWMIGRIGINGFYGGKYEEMIIASGWENHENYNIMLNQRLRANYGAGYWEVLFLHTKPLGVVPKDMRARNKNTSQGKE